MDGLQSNTENYKGFTLSIVEKGNLELIHNLHLHGILFTLDLMETSLHLSKIAQLLGGMAKSTISGYLNKLREHIPPFIEIDIDKTITKRGSKKYYQITDFGKAVLDYKKEIYEKTMGLDLSVIDELAKKEDFENLLILESAKLYKLYGEKSLIKGLSFGGEINRNIEIISASQYAIFAKRISDNKRINIPFKPGKFYSKFSQIRIARMRHIRQLETLLVSFNEQIGKLAKEIQLDIDLEIKNQTLKENDIGLNSIYISTVPIAKE